MVEHSAVNRTVVGSSPTPGAIFTLYENHTYCTRTKKART